MPNPTLTFLRTALVGFTAGDNVAAAAALAAAVNATAAGGASQTWRVIAGGDGITDDYVEIGEPAAGPNPNGRLLVGINPVAGQAAPDGANLCWEQPGPGVNAFTWANYAPSGGRTANAWTSAGATFAARNTGFMYGGTFFATTNLLRLIYSEEILLLNWMDTLAPNYRTVGFRAGAQILPPGGLDAHGEADGRIRGLCTQTQILPNNIWTAGGAWCSTSVSTSQPKACIFDPANPDEILPAVWLRVFGGGVSITPTTNRCVGGGEAHNSVAFFNRLTAGAVGANVSPLSSKASDPTGTWQLGTWRQTRQGPDRVDGYDVTDPPPASNVVSLAWSQDPSTAYDTLYFDNY